MRKLLFLIALPALIVGAGCGGTQTYCPHEVDGMRLREQCSAYMSQYPETRPAPTIGWETDY